MTGIEVPNIDQYVIAFIKANMFTIGGTLAMLKVAAKCTKWAWDDKITTMLTAMFNQIRGKGHTEPPLMGSNPYPKE